MKNTLLITVLLFGTALAQTIISTLPVQNQLNVDRETNISVTFDTDMDQSTINSNTFVIHGSQTGLHSGSYTYDNSSRTATFDPALPFAAGEIAAVILTTDITTQAGHPLLNSFQWSFTINVNNGNGNFLPANHIPVGNNPWSVFASDLDNDQDMDLAVVNKYADSITVLINSGQGVFSDRMDYLTGDNPNTIVSSDLDNDENMDLIVTNSTSDNISVFMNAGNGTFLPKADYPSGDYSSAHISADINNDGYPDVAVLNAFSDDMSILLNNKDGTFNHKTDYPIGKYPNFLASGDFNNDGYVDLAVTNGDLSDDTLFIFKNNGNGTFALNAAYETLLKPYSICAADFNGDGSLDLAVSHFFNSNFSLFLNDGHGAFERTADYPVANFHQFAICAADFDSDNDLDIAVPYMQSQYPMPIPDTVAIFFNNGGGNFSTRQNFAIGYQCRSVFTSDLNGDSAMDIIVTSADTDNITVLFNEGSSSAIHLPSETDNLLKEYALAQNFPNPFNPTTNIEYQISNAAFVTLKIFDTLGREVVTLVNKQMPAGIHTAQWNGKNARGQQVVSGIYYYQIKTNNGYMQTMKMILLK
ncbi:MAG: VCBS repeat-containing protein [Calditrichaceae bacterium]|nr:VCBS repeat-containing protein [Calditrichaceae bacterium]RQV92953.1 MAG: T9SS C-terminal target domain-containing protein [Calditrichota bacterium]